MLAVQDTTLTWKDLSGTINGKQIISSCAGYCKPGEMLAIMGPSGSGKTTLLGLLTRKYDRKMLVTGEVLANNCSFTRQQFHNFGAYIYQNDLLHEVLTVKETLTFTATLRIATPAKAAQKVQELLCQFELQKCEHTLVGGQIKKGISGGQKKRLCIAIEMITAPSLLVLDEPTSGLDSSKAGNVLKTLQKVADKNKTTVILTIHQPSYLLYSMLDRLLVLSNGHVVYQGKANAMAAYMQTLGLPQKAGCTVSDNFMMEISSYKAITDGYETPLNSDNYRKNLEQGVNAQIDLLKSSTEEGYRSQRTQVSFLKMLLTLAQREWRVYVRNPKKLGMMFGNALIAIIIVGCIFKDTIIGASDLANVPNRDILIVVFIGIQSVCFVNITSRIMTSIFAVVLAFPIERDIFTKEVSSKMYSTAAYFLPKVSLDILSGIVGTLLYALAGYWINGFAVDFSKFCGFVLTLFLMAMVGSSIGIMTGSLFQDAHRATEMSPIILMPLMFFSGMYNRLDSIPKWIGWMQYLSPFKYGLHMLMLNEYGDLVLETPTGSYDYRKDLQVDLGFKENVAIVLSLSILFYFLSYLALRRFTANISI